MIRLVLAFNIKGQLRLSRYYHPCYTHEKRLEIESKIVRLVLRRTERNCSVLTFDGITLVYRRYASLFFVMGIEPNMSDEPFNVVYYLEAIHFFVQTLNEYFKGGVREIDLMFELPRVYVVLDEIIQNGQLVETSRANLDVMTLLK